MKEAKYQSVQYDSNYKIQKAVNTKTYYWKQRQRLRSDIRNNEGENAEGNLWVPQREIILFTENTINLKIIITRNTGSSRKQLRNFKDSKDLK